MPIASASAAGTGGQRARLVLLPPGLRAIAAQSSSSAWAVGDLGASGRDEKAVAAHWNGAAWTTLSPAGLPRPSGLSAVAAFPGGAWAVGESGLVGYGDGGGSPTQLLVRLTGTTMRRVPLPGPTHGQLVDVAATSAADAWAVGYIGGGSAGPPLLLHWNGTAWTRWPLPAGMGEGSFTAVAATSATNAWAVTDTAHRGSLPPILHWNGRRWDQVVSPDIGMPYALSDVATTSATDVWAVGSAPPYTYKALILHWNGRRWACARILQIHHPKFPYLYLNAVSASSADNAWAVGSYFDSAYRTLALHWNGHIWKQVMTPQPVPESILEDVAFIPQSGAVWALGVQNSLLLRWNGTAWH